MNAEILEQFEGLYLVYNGRKPLTPDAFAKFFSQYRHALDGCSAETFEKFCATWQYDRDTTRFPYPKEMADLIKALTRRPKEALDGENNKPWEPLGREQYERLTMAEKQRHCLILAGQYRTQAGGMYAKGKGEGWIYPDRAARFVPLAERCDAEAKRLGEIVRASRAQSAQGAEVGRYNSTGSFRHISEALPFSPSHH